MMNKPSHLRFITLTLLATVLTTLFVFLGGPFLRVLRNVFGPAKYWGSVVVIGAGFWLAGLQPLTFLLLSLWVTIGLYAELELRGRSGFGAALGSVLAGSFVLIFGMLSWAKFAGFDMTELLQQGIESLTQQLAARSGNSAVKLDAKAIIDQTPSAIVLLLATALAFALMMDRRTGLILGLRFEKIATHLRLLEFRNPDTLIWVTMISFLLSFVKIQPPTIGVAASNVFNVMLGLYFFQGLAVLEVSFLAFRIGNFTKFLVYFFVVGQLFFLLSIVGIIDYWVDFRGRMKRLRPRDGNQKNGEKI